MKTLWFQILAIIALYGALFYVWYMVKARKGIGAWLTKPKGTREIKLIETMGIAPRTALYLVEVRGQTVLLAISPHGLHSQILGPAKNSFEDALKEKDINPLVIERKRT